MSQIDDKYLNLLRYRYRRASKKEKTAILDEYVKTTGQNRKYAIGVLKGKRRTGKHPIRRPRRAIYGDAEIQALLILSDLFDGICSKRLRAAIDIELPGLYESTVLQVGPGCYDNLMRVSSATMDRLLAGRRPQLKKSRGFTKPGTLLKHQIPIRLYAVMHFYVNFFLPVMKLKEKTRVGTRSKEPMTNHRRIISIFRGNFYHGDTEGTEFYYFFRVLCVSVVRMRNDEVFTPTY